MRMHSHPIVVGELVVEATLDVGDAAMGGSAAAGLVQQHNLVGDLVADQGLQSIGQVGDTHLVRGHTWRNRAPVRVDGLHYDLVVGKMHASLGEAADADDSRL